MEISRRRDTGSTASWDEDVRSNPGNGLVLEDSPFGLEHIYDYEPGGHHPVHLGDCLGPDNRYRVIHKLGRGGPPMCGFAGTCNANP
jgi:hypothetical protein